MEITAGWVVYASDTFRTGGLVQVAPQTSSENLIGGASTNLKGTWALAWVLSSRFEFTGFSTINSRCMYRGVGRSNSLSPM